VVRSAIKRPRVLGTSKAPDFDEEIDEAAVAPASSGAEAADACTSDARISPLAPVPRTVEMSTPNSFARRRAFGEILADEVGDCTVVADAGEAGASIFIEEPARAVGADADEFSVGGFSPGATIHAIVFPT
jgi:zona occludens toxin (predicted ATPase)